ncbi:hypothetical protein [Rubellimicrobium aerolatum]|uniref:Peptidase inhibitor I78 n=1 Tax=Rubellimicrobium aerolatum TaxID=490979 RepID=A0ABW0SGK2_9RHOB|nr:hypothetical protein [Rubellimicrobium aerolatum]MBP1806373.1 hypothetical protein [Rubellimicrobium aerolatum]
MTHARLLAPALALMFLSACDAGPGSEVAPSPDGTISAGEALGEMPLPVLPPMAADTCGGGALAGYIGMEAGSVDPARFEAPVRVIRAGSGPLRNRDPRRINFEVGSMNEIIRVRCG